MIKKEFSVNLRFILMFILLQTTIGTGVFGAMQQDTLTSDTLDVKAKRILKEINNIGKSKHTKDTLNIRQATSTPFVSLQQMLKGNIAGLYVQEPSGEPGVMQSMVLRGLGAPVTNNKDSYNVQPIVYLNGIPLVQDHPFAYDVQKYDYNRIGPATNLLSAIDIRNIKSVEVIKDPLELVKLGPLAANGAIWITTKDAQSGARQISVNSYFSLVQPNNVQTTNGAYEDKFRKLFYNKYATETQSLAYAPYLRDSTNTNYFGPSNWSDLYYKATPAYSIDMSLTGGSERANFRFFGSHTSNASNADDTNLKRYNASFYINMAPFEWLTLSSMINAVRLDRNRNKSLRDRFAETRYLPDLSTPLSPNKASYQNYLNEYDKSVDDNVNNVVQGYVALNFNVKKIKYTTKLSVDYNEGIRDLFVPSTLMETNNYVSNYFGYNQRLLLSNVISYEETLNEKHKLSAELGHNYMSDTHRYNYATAYNGPNDFIKLNVVEGNKDTTGYLTPNSFSVYRYSDLEKLNMMSFYFNGNYDYNNLVKLSAVVRNDGSSTAQPDSRWAWSAAFRAGLNLKNLLKVQHPAVNELRTNLSFARTAQSFLTDRYAGGPQYRVDVGWNDEPTMPSYNAFATISRPYTMGWVGYGLKTPYADKFDFSIEGTFFNSRLNAGLSIYSNTNKQMIFNTAVPLEYGYTTKYESGMSVNNKGIDVLLQGNVLNSRTGLNWVTALNFNFNKNILKALPADQQEIIINDRKFKVGESVDRFWLFQNQGIYTSSDQIPVNPLTNKVMEFKGIPLKVGDPIWKDENGDYVIDDKDKVLKGYMMPKLSGGWSNQFDYKKFDLNFQFSFALGQSALNTSAASQFDFINREASNDLNAVKEIFTWQKGVALDQYPIYNPWSAVVPYRTDQDLFLEDASYMKLKSITLGYHFSTSSLKKVYLYVTGTNLFTLTSFNGDDPELITLMGNYNGYGLPIPRTYMLGLKLDL